MRRTTQLLRALFTTLPGLGLLAAFVALTIGTAQLYYGIGADAGAARADAAEREAQQLRDQLDDADSTIAALREETGGTSQAPAPRGSATPTARPSPRPSATVTDALYADRQLRLPEVRSWDLDEWTSGESDNDVYLDGRGALSTESSAEMALIAPEEAERGRDGCRDATNYVSAGYGEYEYDDLRDAALCVRTTEGAYSILRLTAEPDPDSSVPIAEFTVTTWRA